jgi:acid phosphatase type 7
LTYHFTAAPPVGPGTNSRFIMYGDMGVREYSGVNSPGAGPVLEAVQREIETKGSDFVLHVGDISYGDGRGEVWDAFMSQISPFASSVPYMVGTGNHDYDYRYVS